MKKHSKAAIVWRTSILLSCLAAGWYVRADCVVETISLAPASAPQQVRAFSPGVSTTGTAAPLRIDVDTAHPGQAMDGIGGAFNELGWDALLALPTDRRAEVLGALFDTGTGAALRFNRIPIGASDFGKSAYSLDDTANDWTLAHFSIQRDLGCLIPYVKAAQAVNPAMKFHASPWSPPGWMKTNGSQTGGGELKDDDQTLRAHAAYLARFLTAYAAQGILVNRLCPQNEPLVAGNYPGCKIAEPLFSKAVRQYIVPAVRQTGLPVQVWAGTFNYWRGDTEPHYTALLNDTALAEAIGGISFQYTHLPWVKEYHARYPGVPMQFSESECYNGANAVWEASRDFQDYLAYTRGGCQLFTFWNMVLAEPRTSTWGWRQDSLVVIDKSKQTVTYEPSFALAHFLGREVPQGARYLPAAVATKDAGIGALSFPATNGVGFIQSELSGGEQVAAFARPGGGIVVLLFNQGPQTRVQLNAAGQLYEATLPPASLCALIAK